jgi:glycerol-3-phosphate O-acyltransferase
MTQTVELPIWLLVLILLFAAVTFASHFLFPSVRWFLRRRAERIVTELNKRLERPIQPFKLARRTDTIQRLIYDPKVIEAVTDHARETGVREDVAFEQAKRYAREIVPGFSASAYFGVATRLARWFSTKLYRVRLDHHDEAALADIDEGATLVFVMNHRSNMDYVLVTYLAADRSALAYAVGEWARVWPLTPLIKAMGAYFIRRRSRNALYRRVLARYVQIATAGGVNQAVFPEGGLSLDGRVGIPRLGLLSYIIEDFNPAGTDVVFVPVALNYDRVIEDRLLIEADRAGVRKFRGSIPSAVAFTARYIWRRLRGKAQRFGHAGVAFGAPLSLRKFLEQIDGRDPTAAVGRELMVRIGAMVPVLPVPLVLHRLLAHDGAMEREELVAEIAEAHRRMTQASIPIVAIDDDAGATADYALRHLEMRKIAKIDGTRITLAPDAGDISNFYANSISQHMNADAARPATTGETKIPAET